MLSSVVRFTVAYVKSMRLYYAFVTGIAGWVGVSFYEYLAPYQFSRERAVVILMLLFLSWGINQIVNDFLGLKEDRINAPHRPMVTGELNPYWAMGVTVALLAAMLVVSWQLNPWSIIPALLGMGLNVVYEYAKAFSLWGNLVFGLAIAMCTGYGFLASGPLVYPIFTNNRLAVFILIVILNALMTYYTYFKDYQGDKQAGKRTFIVRHGINISRYVGLAGAFVSALALFFFMFIGWLPFGDIQHKQTFIFCGLLTLFLQCRTAYLFFSHPVGKRTYYSLVVNIQACVAGEATLISIYNEQLALYLLIASYVLIGVFFNQYKDAQA